MYPNYARAAVSEFIHICFGFPAMSTQSDTVTQPPIAASKLARSFTFCTGIENSAPTITGPDGRRLRIDEMAASGHYQLWRDDFRLVRELGLHCLRYGVPYYRTHLAPGQYDWSFADEAFAELHRLGIVPIADLCHFSLPDWLGTFQNPDFPRYFAEYAEAFARRYPWVWLYTPVNEMLITAEYSALKGYWNEQLCTDAAFLTALVNAVEANVRASEAILKVRDAWFVQSESTRYYHPANPDALTHTAHLNERRFLSLDLNYSHAPSGRILRYMLENGVPMAKFDYFMNRSIRPRCIMGTDYYQTSEMRVTPDGDTHRCHVLGYYGLARQYYERFRLPIMHSETNQFQILNAAEWLERQWGSVLRLRLEGYPMVGFTWYSLTDQADWDIDLRERRGQVNTSGLYDMQRRIRKVGIAYRQIISDWRDALAGTEIRY
ncbi:family 1 glycosylhydrolase [Massilia terrae]|uniref:Family 1 glycosylhydrolase n=1 Tax=Massilia terrae TaxID=1811224 RepID=A0ABT2CUL4_9BURK|nr:family 1 glycosylhydrolase [Massilia terrae]